MWFKRDLRLRDHAALEAAINEGIPTLLVYLFEPSLVCDPHYDVRHWRFVWESLQGMNAELAPHGLAVMVAYREALDFFGELIESVRIHQLLSYEETRILFTYDRHLGMKRFCQ